MRAGVESGVAVAVLAALLGVGCGSKEETARAGAPRDIKFPVEVMAVQSQVVEFAVNAVGSVEAFERVQVTARVAGVVEQVRFREGDTVKKGQVLLEIEPARFRLQADSARASMAKTASAVADAEAGLARREAANAQNAGVIPAEDLETWRTKVQAAQAERSEKKVAVQRAELDLRDAYVRAPRDGVIQVRQVETGQYVQPGVTLASLVMREPLLLRFQVPEPEATPLKKGMKTNFTVRDSSHAFSARIVHVAEVADTASRMVPVTAEIDDPTREVLRPGAFAEVVVPVGDQRQAPVIPQTAVRPSEKGFLAYVVEEDVARERVLVLGMRTADGRVEVKSGLKAGEKLVVRGAEALRDGAPVKIDSGKSSGVSPEGTAGPGPDAGASARAKPVEP